MRANVFLPILIFLTSLYSKDTYTIKMATVAPEGSSWMRIMHRFDKEIGELTNGQIKFKIYPNGVQGSDIDVLRKMRIGQIHAASFTGVGLGEIVPEIRVLEIPFLFRSSDEVDYVYNTLFEDFQKRFEERGFFLAAWAEVGFVYLFTQSPVKKLDDFRKVKMWLWAGDPLAQKTFEIMKIPAIPLDLTDVYTSLQTGLINGVYISPYGAIALQWYTKTKFMLDYPITNSIGAVLITKEKLNSLPEEYQQILITKTKEYMREIVEKGRQENLESIKVLQKAGIKVLEIDDSKTLAEIEKCGLLVGEELIGKLYSRELFDRVINLLKEYRSTHSS